MQVEKQVLAQLVSEKMLMDLDIVLIITFLNIKMNNYVLEEVN